MNLSIKSINIRFFLTCWLIFCLHFATDFVREHFLVLSIVEDCSFRLDKYMGLHNDIFITENHGAHHGANPGASMIAALPTFLFKPFMHYMADKFNEDDRVIGDNRTAIYKDHRPARKEFYEQVREKGLDVKFGLIGGITMLFCMAPISAFGAVVMLLFMRDIGFSKRMSLYMAFVYAFGTPIFFRTAFLNQNLMVGIFSFIAFWQIYRISKMKYGSINMRLISAGFLTGTAVLCDYSGLIFLVLLFVYGIISIKNLENLIFSLKKSLWYVCGAVPPIFLLWFYQWRSFGNPFFPGQHYMPPVEWIEIGYQGFGIPDLGIFWMLFFDYRFGLFVVSPMLILSILLPFLNNSKKTTLRLRETFFSLTLFLSFSIFLSCIQYTRLQWVSGIRYIIPIIPFLFLMTANVLIRIPRIATYTITIISIGMSWAMSMSRRGVDDPNESMLLSLKSVFLEGFQLPWLNTLAKMEINYLPITQPESLALPLILITGFIVFGIWWFRKPSKKNALTKSSKNI